MAEFEQDAFSTGAEPQMDPRENGQESMRERRETGNQDGFISGADPIGGTREQACAPDLGAAFRKVVINSRNKRTLSHEGKVYLDAVTADLKHHGVRMSEMPEDGTYVAHAGDAGVALVFDEVQRSPSIDDEFIPACVHLNRIASDDLFQAKLAQKNITKLDTMVIIPRSDYIDMDRRDTIAQQENKALIISSIASNAIRNIIELALGAEFNLQDMERFPIRLVTNPNEVKQHINDLCPAGVTPFWEIGCAVEICLDPRYQADRGRNRNPDRNYYSWDCLFALGASVEFLDSHENGDHRFLPMITLTVCESTVKSLKMLPFMLAVAEEVFIQQRLYMEPFRVWGIDNTYHNLGLLVNNPSNDELCDPLRTQSEFEAFCRDYLGDPFLAADVRYGAWNHPALECLIVGEAGIDTLNDELNELNPGTRIDAANLVLDSIPFYSGTVNDDGIIKDSRAIDYWRVIQSNRDASVLEQFRGYTDDPEDRLRAIAAAGWKTSPSNMGRNTKIIESLYDTYKLILDAGTICDMVETANNLNIIRNFRTSSMGAFNFSSLREQGRIFRQRERGLFRGSREGGRNVGTFFTGYGNRRRCR